MNFNVIVFYGCFIPHNNTALHTLIRISFKQQIQIMRKFNRAITQPNSPNFLVIGHEFKYFMTSLFSKVLLK